ncbi:MAG TPA: hypothetical protein VGT61_02680 [Thermomicrobiales bacterium]|nr:hypothetical protein [Thermomicrobiales bacterium]
MRKPVEFFTAIALFDQSLDAEKSLAAVQRQQVSAETVSLIIRDRASASDRSASPLGDVARALVASAMGPLGPWLRGLASLVVAERGTYLVAGPMGASLATLCLNDQRSSDPPDEGQDEDLADLLGIEHEESDALYQNLLLFGLNEDDASYLERRLVAGTSLVAVTTSSRRITALARNEFDSQGAVFLRVVLTSGDIVRLTRQRINDMTIARLSGDVVVADAVIPLRRMCHRLPPQAAHPRCGATITDTDGVEIGTLVDILSDPFVNDRSGREVERYAVVGHGGLGYGNTLRIGRHYTAIPMEQLSFDEDGTARSLVDAAVIREAPRYDRSGAFSRREELGVLAYFGVRPYWLAAPEDESAN